MLPRLNSQFQFRERAAAAAAGAGAPKTEVSGFSYFVLTLASRSCHAMSCEIKKFFPCTRSVVIFVHNSVPFFHRLISQFLTKVSQVLIRNVS